MTAEPAIVVASTVLPTRRGQFTAMVIGHGGNEHLLLVRGDVSAGRPLVRLHSECLTGDVFGSLRCDCGDQLDCSLAAIDASGAGVLVYLRGHEGRGIGLGAKLRAYALQQRGLDTIEANLALGLPVDDRDYGAAAAALRLLRVRAMVLLTNNPDKVEALRTEGFDCTVRAMPARDSGHNARYLATKANHMGHRGLLDDHPLPTEAGTGALHQREAAEWLAGGRTTIWRVG